MIIKPEVTHESILSAFFWVSVYLALVLALLL